MSPSGSFAGGTFLNLPSKPRASNKGGENGRKINNKSKQCRQLNK